MSTVEHIGPSKRQTITFFSKAGFFQSTRTLNTTQDPNYRYGQETDAVAEKVGRMPVPQPIFQPFFRPSMSSLQRKCAHCKEESKEVHRKEINRDDIPMNKDLENYVGKLHESGKALSNSEKNFYEPKLRFDFSKVKVHTDHNAAHSAQSINALAYTVGNNIVFNNGQYSPNSDKGKRLLGHELTHVVQQSQAKSNFIQKQDEVLAESEAMRDRFRAERRRDLRRIIDCISFRKIRRDCPSSTGVRLADVLARMRTRVAGNRLCIQFFQERFRINPDIMFDPSRRPSITYVPLLGRSGLTRCPEPTCDSPIPSVSVGTANASDNICNSPLLERTIMHELIHYAHCYRRWGDVGDEATSEAGATICMGSVQEALDAARRRRATVPP